MSMTNTPIDMSYLENITKFNGRTLKNRGGYLDRILSNLFLKDANFLSDRIISDQNPNWPKYLF